MRSRSWRTSTIAAAALAATLVWAGCRDVSGPVPGNPGDPAFHEGGEGNQPANFRLTGGGRIDQRDHAGWAKNTPDSRDFATFGFQARPIGPNTTDGSGNITWVEHNPGAPGGGFTFHGRVTFFTRPTDENAADGDCGRFGGTGSGRRRDGMTFEDLPFTVTHACDKGEPGVGRDHIRFETLGYDRHGILSGGNIQKHKQ
jgi:hypothetical protein